MSFLLMSPRRSSTEMTVLYYESSWRGSAIRINFSRNSLSAFININFLTSFRFNIPYRNVEKPKDDLIALSWGKTN